MTLSELAAALAAINAREQVDEFRDHIDADDLLIAYIRTFGPLGDEAAKEYEAIGKWYS